MVFPDQNGFIQQLVEVDTDAKVSYGLDEQNLFVKLFLRYTQVKITSRH